MSELARQVDERTLHFGPWGFGGAMPAQDRLSLLHVEMGELELGDRVPGSVRSQWAKLQRTYVDGLFIYEHFTAAERDAYRVLEIALKARFLEHYEYRIPLDVADKREIVEVRSFEAFRGRVAHRRGDTVLPDHPRFNGSFAALIHWARREGLFFGQVNRIREAATVRLRNSLLHCEHDTLLMPPDTARTLGLHYQWIQRLWGYHTPGGKSYPGSFERTPWIVGFEPLTGESTWFPIERSEWAMETRREGMEWFVVLATDREHLADWRLGLESTGTPVDRIWGPGSWEDLPAEVAANGAQWATDRVTVLDRLFFIRQTPMGLDVARRASAVRTLKERDPAERWSVIRADGPGWARAHVMEGHRQQGPCGKCPVDAVMTGARRDTAVAYARLLD